MVSFGSEHVWFLEATLVGLFEPEVLLVELLAAQSVVPFESERCCLVETVLGLRQS